MKITSLALLCGFNEARRFSFVDHPSNCRAAGVDVSQEGLDHTNCNSSSKRCSLVCKTTEGFQRVGAGNFRCRKNNHTGELKLHPGHMEPKCLTCNKLGESGLDEKQFDVTKKVLRSGLTKNFIRCKNGKNVLPSNRNFEYVECYCHKRNKKCYYRQQGREITREKLEAMNCGVPEADKDPLADDEPVTPSSGQFDEDGNDVRRIPPGLVCSDQDRIVGGLDAIHNSWPWIVMLSYKYYGNSYQFQCSGTLINEDTIITAGHCCHGWHHVSNIKGTIGQHNRGEHDDGEFTVFMKSKHKHSGYRQSTLENDICILKTKQSIDFKVHGAVAAKACLPARGEDPQPAGTRCWAAGWGRMAWKGKVANILQEVDLPLISDSVCAKTNNERYFKPEVMFCAGWLEGGKDACTGDSGGPLICAENDRPVLRGITSWGLGCAEANAPGVYTRVEKYLDWIEDLM